jgi:hypothetical protein
LQKYPTGIYIFGQSGPYWGESIALPARRAREATGVIVDLFAEQVGFYAGWGFSRSVSRIDPRLVTPGGHVDWRAVDALVAGALCEVLSPPPAGLRGVPSGARPTSPAELYMRVAVGQHCSGWSPLPRGGGRRLVALRCHVGKRRAAGKRKNQVRLQYRLWKRGQDGKPVRVTSAARARPLLADLHAEILERLEGE